MAMMIAIIFDILILVYFGSKVEIAAILAESLADRITAVAAVHKGRKPEGRHPYSRTARIADRRDRQRGRAA